MKYFYRIGNKVLASNKKAEKALFASPTLPQYEYIEFGDNAQVFVVTEGDVFN